MEGGRTNMINPKISIITVCYNAEKVIEETIRSVIGQTYSNIEYIIIDGDSKDKTLEIINKNMDDYHVRLYSEPDKGIYDAMNKGLAFSTGQYINFLNAGDSFINKSVVQRIVGEIQDKQTDIFYGNIIYKYPDGRNEIRQYGKWCGKQIYFLTGDCINHQAIFATKISFEQDLFDLHYRVCADREWMMRISKRGFRFQSVHFAICKYSLDEESTSIRLQELYHKEVNQCIKQHYPLGYYLFKVFDFIRGNKILSNTLHKVYGFLYIRKEVK